MFAKINKRRKERKAYDRMLKSMSELLDKLNALKKLAEDDLLDLSNEDDW